ncbi:MAG: hypothetical protein KA401_04200 [Anaerolineae bacterium]|nr:hypothetical protein [Chloroflexota bacterium]MBP6298526.1 hypothetical protein [Anaerolineae bacterium]
MGIIKTKSNLRQDLFLLDLDLDQVELEMPKPTYMKLRQRLDAILMEMQGYQRMNFFDALNSGKKDIVLFDRSNTIVNPTKTGGVLWEFNGGSVSEDDPVWAK